MGKNFNNPPQAHAEKKHDRVKQKGFGSKVQCFNVMLATLWSSLNPLKSLWLPIKMTKKSSF